MPGLSMSPPFGLLDFPIVNFQIIVAETKLQIYYDIDIYLSKFLTYRYSSCGELNTNTNSCTNRFKLVYQNKKWLNCKILNLS